MMHVPHELREEFSHDASLVERLAKTDYDFQRLAMHYDAVNRQIDLIESEEAPTSDEVLQQLKKERLLLKDEIAEKLRYLKHRM